MANDDKKQGLKVLAIYKGRGVFLPALDRLGEEGFAVQSVENAYQAVASLAKQPADAVIVELDPLDDSELDAIRICRELNRDVFILGMFSQSHRSKAGEALKLGADACLSLPSYPGELIWMLL